jgi:dihydrodipicolinate synthase/N-acetylneuraminate lyase
LTRYYLDAGAGGLAVGVHTTQFDIHLPKIGLLAPVLSLAQEEIETFSATQGKPIIKIAGVIGETEQATVEAGVAAEMGYHAALLGLASFQSGSNETLIAHAREVANIIPLFGFYLQPAVGGRHLDYGFWREFCEIENLVAIKIAPFDRYRTIDVVRAVVESGRADSIALYTGNDDNIVADLLTAFEFPYDGVIHKKKVVGGLLGHWAVWTRSAVDLLDRVRGESSSDDTSDLLSEGAKITDCNAAFFDAANNFQGCVVGIHEVLRRQGLLEGTWTLNPDECVSGEQRTEIDRVYETYPELNDDSFVRENLDRWLT